MLTYVHPDLEVDSVTLQWASTCKQVQSNIHAWLYGKQEGTAECAFNIVASLLNVAPS